MMDSILNHVGGDNPDVAELKRGAVFLKHQRPRRSFTKPGGGAVGWVEFLILIERDVIEGDGRAGVGGLVAGGVEARGAEIDVQGLPFVRGFGWIDGGAFGFVGAVVERSG